MQLMLEHATYLGPARVARTAGPKVQLELPDEFAWAQTALTFPYQLAEGDVVLAIGRSGAWYVIGLLSGSGTTTLTVPGDLVLRAPCGRIELTAADGIALKSRRVAVTADKLELLARTVIERFGRAARSGQQALQGSCVGPGLAGRRRVALSEADVGAPRGIRRQGVHARRRGGRLHGHAPPDRNDGSGRRRVATRRQPELGPSERHHRRCEALTGVLGRNLALYPCH